MPFVDSMSIISDRPTVHVNVPATVLRTTLEEHGGIASGHTPELAATLTDEEVDTVEATGEEDNEAMAVVVAAAVEMAVTAEVVQVEEIMVDEDGCRWTEAAPVPSHLDD